MDGLLVIDKPSGPTSHDVVARMRRVLGERRIGHTGTLDPLASGVLPLVIGRATRLARFLSGSDKTYEAVVRLGFATETGDAEGSAVGPTYAGNWPTRDVIEAALGSFRGQFLQLPPAFSAKKIGGRRSYDMARRARQGGCQLAATWQPAGSHVTVLKLAVTALDADRVSLTLTCSAGFYVRALARDLGERLGTGGHLAALRRTRVGTLPLDAAIPLDAAERDPTAATARVVPLSRMLTEWPAMTLDADAVRRTLQGQDLEATGGRRPSGFVRLVDQTGDLVAIAEAAQGGAGLLHPCVVLR